MYTSVYQYQCKSNHPIKEKAITNNQQLTIGNTSSSLTKGLVISLVSNGKGGNEGVALLFGSRSWLNLKEKDWLSLLLPRTPAYLWG